MRTSFTAILAVLLACACADRTTAPDAPNEATLVDEPTMSSGVVHRASVGAEDPFCAGTGQPPGCDGNFSLVANQRADGTVTGQWQDTFGFGGGDGVHVSVDCLNVVGNGAVIGGVITRGSALGTDFTGMRSLSAAIDNGSSVNDPLDQTSFSWVVTGPTGLPVEDTPCTELQPSDFILFDVTHGQVKVE